MSVSCKSGVSILFSLSPLSTIIWHLSYILFFFSYCSHNVFLHLFPSSLFFLLLCFLLLDWILHYIPSVPHLFICSSCHLSSVVQFFLSILFKCHVFASVSGCFTSLFGGRKKHSLYCAVNLLHQSLHSYLILSFSQWLIVLWHSVVWIFESKISTCWMLTDWGFPLKEIVLCEFTVL